VRGGRLRPQARDDHNTGSASLVISSLQITGTDASQFSILSAPGTTDAEPGQSINLSIVFNPPSGTSAGSRRRSFASRATTEQAGEYVYLRGLATTGLGRTNEPSLQRILDLYQIR